MRSARAIRVSFLLPDAEATDRLAVELMPLLEPGDTLLLSGEIGAGKSHLTRRIIQTIMPQWGAPAEDVPSPTYTLVQIYETPRAEIWHADLYRLGDPGEITELGLFDAFGAALCCVEWPDRLGPDAPTDALSIHLEIEGHGRRATLTATAERWTPVLDTLRRTHSKSDAA